MSLRAPNNAFSRFQDAQSGSPLEAEIAAEKAAALGRAGRALADALADLGDPDAEADRESLLLSAARAAQAYFVQRELIGLRDQREIIREYRIPDAVLARIGIMRRQSEA